MDMFTVRDLHQTQKDCITWMLGRQSGCVASECGSGKTVMGLTAFLIYRRKTGIRLPMLAVSVPKGVKETWSVEHKRWQHLKDLRVATLAGTPTRREKILEDGNFDVLCVSYGLLNWLAELKKIGFPNTNFSFIFADEGSCLKGHASKWRVALSILSIGANARFIATATPAPHDAMDYWGLVKYLDDGRCLNAKTISQFRSIYCQAFPIPNTSGVFYRIKSRETAREIEKKVAPFFYSFETPEVPIETVDVLCSLSPESMALYKRIEKEQCLNSIADKETGKPVMEKSLGAMDLANKLAQVANGFVYVDKVLKLSPETIAELERTEDEKEVRQIMKKNSVRETINLFPDRIELCKKMVKAVRTKHPDSSIAVAYLFTHDLKVLQEAFPEGVSDTEEDIAARWNRGEIPLLFLQYARCSKSLNLQQSGYVLIMYTSTFNWEHDYQIARRFARQGQKAPKVYVYRLHLKGTVDDLKSKVLDKRGNSHVRFQKDILRYATIAAA